MMRFLGAVFYCITTSFSFICTVEKTGVISGQLRVEEKWSVIQQIGPDKIAVRILFF